MKIIRSSNVVIEFVLDLIMKGEVKPGDKLPSTKNLAKTIGTTVISARKADQNLAAQVMTKHITEVIESWKKHVSPVQEKTGKNRSGIYKNPIHRRLR